MFLLCHSKVITHVTFTAQLIGSKSVHANEHRFANFKSCTFEGSDASQTTAIEMNVNTDGLLFQHRILIKCSISSLLLFVYLGGRSEQHCSPIM